MRMRQIKKILGKNILKIRVLFLHLFLSILPSAQESLWDLWENNLRHQRGVFCKRVSIQWRHLSLVEMSPHVDTCRDRMRAWLKKSVQIHNHQLRCRSIRAKILRFDLNIFFLFFRLCACHWSRGLDSID